jgi:transposase
MNGKYRLAGIDVHKSMLAVVVVEVTERGLVPFERRKFRVLESDLKMLSQWFAELDVQEAVMESTAQYWKPVWRELEGHCALHLAQAQSNRAPRGRKRDFADAERLVRRYVAGELILSFVPDPEQRLWRTATRTKYQLTCDRVRLQNQLESLLEDAHLKLDTCVSDLLGLSSRRMLQAIAKGENDPKRLASLREENLRATEEQLAEALSRVGEMSGLHRQILQLFLDRLKLIEDQIELLHHQIALALRNHQQAVVRLAAVPGLGVDSSQQIVAEVGPAAATFSTAEQLASWVGVCPGREESAEISKSNRSPKGNRMMRRVLSQAANAAVKTQGSIFQLHYRRLVPRMGHNKAIWAIAHRLCRIVWLILHRGVDYIEYGTERNQKAQQLRTSRQLRQLRALGYQIIPPAPTPQLQ